MGVDQDSADSANSERHELLERIDLLNAEIDRIQDLWRKEQLDIAQDLEYLKNDILENDNNEKRAIILYHHDCMSGTDCDACRIIWRINEISKRLLPNTPHERRAVPHPSPGQPPQEPDGGKL